MNILKSSLLLLSAVMLFSCTQDGSVEQVDETTNLTATISNYDNSNLGMYKGAFTTLDATERGVVEVAILDNVLSRATVTLASGRIYNLASTKTVTTDQNVEGLHFTLESDSRNEFSFDFMVENDGSNPQITNVSFSNNEGDIVILKQTSRGPVLSIITGTYVCDAPCNNHPNFPMGDNTFNIMIEGVGDGAIVTTQVTIYGAAYVAEATNSQSGCVNGQGAIVTCTITGSTNFDNKIINWTGTHQYPNGNNFICSDILGTWSVETVNWGTLTGTFTDDALIGC